MSVDTPTPLARVERDTLARAAAAADSAAAYGVFIRYRAELSPQTRRAHAADLARWTRYLVAIGVEATGSWAEEPSCWSAVSWGLVEGFVAWQEREGYTLASIARALSTVRAYCKRAAQAGVLTTEALRLVESVRTPTGRAARNRDTGRERTRIGTKKAEAIRITRTQARQLKRQQPDTPQGRRDALLMALLLDHGLRVGELAGLKVTDLDVQAGLLRFYRPKVHKEQTHRLSRDALHAASRYLEAGDAPAVGSLLRGGAEGQPGHTGKLGAAGMSVGRIAERVRTLGRVVGLDRLSPHDCRHAWATWASESGTPIRDLQEAGGWASPAMPLRYAQAAAIANERVDLGYDETS